MNDSTPPKMRFPPAVALPGSSPRPWETRRFGECAYPIDSDEGLLSCCLKVEGEKRYCKAHCKVMYAPTQSRAR